MFIVLLLDKTNLVCDWIATITEYCILYEGSSELCLQSECNTSFGQLGKDFNNLYLMSNWSGGEDCSDEMTEKNKDNASDYGVGGYLFQTVKVRVSRGHGYHVLYVPTLFFDLFLPVAYTSSDPKVYGSFRFFK